jgi:hypothetical protein
VHQHLPFPHLLLLQLRYCVLGDQQPYYWHQQQRYWMIPLAPGLRFATAAAVGQLMVQGQLQGECCWLLRQR